ncbi:MAG: LicD family protein [Prevotella sp.]|nr:LicD family protein [Prevotella sp.]
MVKELTLEDIQEESKRILKVIDSFCIKNKISYSLGYGALIGAIRHKDCIPWDDDIDIIMTRPNYNRLVELFNNSQIAQENELEFFAPELGNSFFSIARICDMKRTRVRKYYQWTDAETGLWIDIFPIDSMPEDGGKALRIQSSICYNICGSRVPISRELDFKRVLKIIGKRCLYGWKNIDMEIKRYNSMIMQLPEYGSCDTVCNIGSPYGIKDTHRKDIFERYNRVEFGGIETMVIAEYDVYLRAIYGDYMQLPPLSKQVRGHSDNKYFWK